MGLQLAITHGDGARVNREVRNGIYFLSKSWGKTSKTF